MVHDRRVATDGAGRFRAAVQARGGLMVRVRTPRYHIGGKIWVALKPGRRRYDVKLRLEPTPPWD